MQFHFYYIKRHTLLGFAATYTFILLSFSPLFPVSFPVNANKMGSDMVCGQDAFLKFLMGEQPLFLIMTPAWCNQNPESFCSARWLNPHIHGSAWPRTLHCNLKKGHSLMYWTLLLGLLSVIYMFQLFLSLNAGKESHRDTWQLVLWFSVGDFSAN